jgi:hypothetical protein
MKISGHKTDSMERRYDIAGDEGMDIAKDLMARRMNGLSAVDIAKELEELAEFRRAAAAKKSVG